MKLLFELCGLRFLLTFFRALQNVDPATLSARPNDKAGQAIEVLCVSQMKRLYLIGCILLFSGCASGISEENLDLLNGYWEIEEVIFPDGSTKDYNVNTSVDYILVEDKKGYRKKVQPKFNGKFDTSNDADLFVILQRDDIFSINYNTENNDGLAAQRSEELIRLSENSFSVRNAEGLTYNYKRFEPINVKE